MTAINSSIGSTSTHQVPYGVQSIQNRKRFSSVMTSRGLMSGKEAIILEKKATDC